MSQNTPPENKYELLNVNVLENVKENKTSKREKKKRQIINYIVENLQKKTNPKQK